MSLVEVEYDEINTSHPINIKIQIVRRDIPTQAWDSLLVKVSDFVGKIAHHEPQASGTQLVGDGGPVEEIRLWIFVTNMIQVRNLQYFLKQINREYPTPKITISSYTDIREYL